MTVKVAPLLKEFLDWVSAGSNVSRSEVVRVIVAVVMADRGLYERIRGMLERRVKWNRRTVVCRRCGRILALPSFMGDGDWVYCPGCHAYALLKDLGVERK